MAALRRLLKTDLNKLREMYSAIGKKAKTLTYSSLVNLKTAAGSEGLDTAYKWAIQSAKEEEPRAAQVRNLDLSKQFGTDYDSDSK